MEVNEGEDEETPKEQTEEKEEKGTKEEEELKEEKDKEKEKLEPKEPKAEKKVAGPAVPRIPTGTTETNDTGLNSARKRRKSTEIEPHHLVKRPYWTSRRWFAGMVIGTNMDLVTAMFTTTLMAKHGGVFFLFYCISQLLIAFPSHVHISALFQFAAIGPIKLFRRLCPPMQGVGYLFLLSILLKTILLAYLTGFSAFFSTVVLPSEKWATCDQNKTKHCNDHHKFLECTEKYMHLQNNKCTRTLSKAFDIVWECVKNPDLRYVNQTVADQHPECSFMLTFPDAKQLYDRLKPHLDTLIQQDYCTEDCQKLATTMKVLECGKYTEVKSFEELSEDRFRGVVILLDFRFRTRPKNLKIIYEHAQLISRYLEYLRSLTGRTNSGAALNVTGSYPPSNKTDRNGPDPTKRRTGETESPTIGGLYGDLRMKSNLRKNPEEQKWLVSAVRLVNRRGFQTILGPCQHEASIACRKNQLFLDVTHSVEQHWFKRFGSIAQLGEKGYGLLLNTQIMVCFFIIWAVAALAVSQGIRVVSISVTLLTGISVLLMVLMTFCLLSNIHIHEALRMYFEWRSCELYKIDFWAAILCSGFVNVYSSVTPLLNSHCPPKTDVVWFSCLSTLTHLIFTLLICIGSAGLSGWLELTSGLPEEYTRPKIYVESSHFNNVLMLSTHSDLSSFMAQTIYVFRFVVGFKSLIAHLWILVSMTMDSFPKLKTYRSYWWSTVWTIAYAMVIVSSFICATNWGRYVLYMFIKLTTLCVYPLWIAIFVGIVTVAIYGHKNLSEDIEQLLPSVYIQNRKPIPTQDYLLSFREQGDDTSETISFTPAALRRRERLERAKAGEEDGKPTTAAAVPGVVLGRTVSGGAARYLQQQQYVQQEQQDDPIIHFHQPSVCGFNFGALLWSLPFVKEIAATLWGVVIPIYCLGTLILFSIDPRTTRAMEAVYVPSDSTMIVLETFVNGVIPLLCVGIGFLIEYLRSRKNLTWSEMFHPTKAWGGRHDWRDYDDDDWSDSLADDWSNSSNSLITSPNNYSGSQSQTTQLNDSVSDELGGGDPAAGGRGGKRISNKGGGSRENRFGGAARNNRRPSPEIFGGIARSPRGGSQIHILSDAEIAAMTQQRKERRRKMIIPPATTAAAASGYFNHNNNNRKSDQQAAEISPRSFVVPPAADQRKLQSMIRYLPAEAFDKDIATPIQLQKPAQEHQNTQPDLLNPVDLTQSLDSLNLPQLSK